MSTVPLHTILTVAYAANVPLLLIGPPGVGKSSIIRQFAATLRIPCETTNASTMEPADIGGYPVQRDTHAAKLPSQWAYRLTHANDGILFIDELTTAPPSTQAASLRVIHEGVLGDCTLPVGIRRWSACNPPEYASDGHVLSAPLANRFMHIQTPLVHEAWVRGIINGFTAPAYLPPPPGWEAGIPAVAAMVAAYIQRNPSALLDMPSTEAARGGAWPSPRTWEMGIRVLAAADAMRMGDDVATECLAGCVGTGAAVGFLAWRRAQDLPDPKALLATRTWNVPVEGHKAFTTMAAIVATVAHDLTRDNWDAGWALLALASNRHADLVAIAAKSMAELRRKCNYPAPSGMAQLAHLLKAINVGGR